VKPGLKLKSMLTRLLGAVTSFFWIEGSCGEVRNLDSGAMAKGGMEGTCGLGASWKELMSGAVEGGISGVYCKGSRARNEN